MSHLEVVARGRLWRQLASRGINRGAQRVNAYLFALSSSCDCRPRCRQSWTLISTPIQVHVLQNHLLIGNLHCIMTSKGLVSLDPEGEGVVVSPHLIGCEHCSQARMLVRSYGSAGQVPGERWPQAGR